MIVTVTLNPAMDVVMKLDTLKKSMTNRIQKKFECVGGKGTHISVNLSKLGIPSIAVGTARGRTGNKIMDVLGEEKLIEVRFLYLTTGDSRTNYILVDGKADNTIIAEKGNMLAEEDLDQFIDIYRNAISGGDYVVISGDASNHSRGSLQDDLIDIAYEKGARLCLDVSGPVLEKGIQKSPFFVKPNIEELSYLCKKVISTKEDIIEGIREIEKHGVPHIVISCGNKGCFALSDGVLYHVLVPDVQVLNTAGCGDSLVAGLLAGFYEGLDMKENLRRANAVATAAAMNEATAGFDASLIEDLTSQVQVEILQNQ